MTYQYVVQGDTINGFLRPFPERQEPHGVGFASTQGAKQLLGTREHEGYWPDIAEPAALGSTKDEVFYPLYMQPDTGDLIVPLSDAVDPKLQGSIDNPDAKIRLSLEAFHMPSKTEGERASIRIDVSQDGEFVRGNDTLHWIVASGLDLYKEATGGNKTRKQPNELKADLDKPFLGRAVSLPGAGGYIKISIYAHPEPSPLEQIWESIVSLFRSPTGLALGATVGFPAITLPAVEFFNGLIQKLKMNSDEAMMETKKLRCAFTKRALDEMILGSRNVFPVLNQGFYILAPAGKLSMLRELKPRYLGGFGLLKPTVGPEAKLSNEAYLDAYANGKYPFSGVPYAVVTLRAQEANLAKEWL